VLQDWPQQTIFNMIRRKTINHYYSWYDT